MIWTLAQVAVGGAFGSVARYLVGLGAARMLGESFPWGTFAVNVAGSLVIGMLAAAMAGGRLDPAHAPLMVAGFLGGFTTFSAFSLDALTLMERGQGGQAVVYVAASVGLSLVAVAVGALLMRWVLA